MEATNIEKALFTLVRNAIFSDGKGAERQNVNLTHPEWGDLLTLAAKQGLFAIAYDGLSNSNRDSLQKDIAIRWSVGIEQIEKRYTRQIAVLNELSAIFKKRGVEIMLLKGPLLGSLYPVKEHREFGDLDIYLPGNYMKGNEIVEKLGIAVDTSGDKHSKFVYRGISIENHKSFLNINLSKTDTAIENELHDILSYQGVLRHDNQSLTLFDNLPVNLPSHDFNALFNVRHAIVHFLSNGLVLRHFTDLGLLFEKEGDKIDFKRVVKILYEQKQLKLFLAFLSFIKNNMQMERGLNFTKRACEELEIEFEPLLKDENLEKKIYFDTMRGIASRPNVDTLLAMPLLKRKLTGAMRLYNSRWKYDAIDKNLYFNTFIKRVLQAFKQ
ncbi:MAG: nucleotidyltransferase family protein [Bacteroidales bacterium]